MPVTEDIVLIGGGGHALSCLNVIRRGGRFHPVGILDRDIPIGESVDGVCVVGTDADRDKWVKCGAVFHVASGMLRGNNRRREHLFTLYQSEGGRFPVLVDPAASIAESAVLGEGTILMPGARINAGAETGLNVIVNTGAIIEHGARIGSHVHVATSAVVNGECRVGEGCFIGSGALLRNGIEVVQGTTVGMGAVVVKSITVPGTYTGNPARRVA